MTEVRTRYAPSPTGYMHIGNLRTALYAYLFARKHGGKFLLRIEDTDQERYVEGAVEVIYDTLRTVGIQWDEGPDIGGPYGPYVQSERKAAGIYQQYAEELIERGGAYRCFCSKERLEALRKEAEARKVPFKYDGHCRHMPRDEVRARLAAGEPYVIRQAIPEAGKTSFHDEVYGDVTVDNATLGDGILIKADGFPTYNFANVIDDHLMQVTHVMRGSEFLSSTPRFILLYQAFGWPVPVHIHLPPIMKSATEKLSKRHGDASFQDLLAQGYLPQAILNYIALLGWGPGTDEEFFSLEEMVERFSIEGLSKSPAIFDEKKLRWMNGEYIRRMPLEDFEALAAPYYGAAASQPDTRRKLSALLQPRVERLADIPGQIDFVAQLPDYDVSLYVNKKMKTDLALALDSLQHARAVLAELADWNLASIQQAMVDLAARLGRKNGQVMYPVRVALSGKEFTPGGAVELADLLGREESLRRIDLGIEKLAAAV
ncbi:glutamate--tRNA ligase [Alicyclobacillus cellulosilyticus]|uniref:Glutamate--tRNA ligase n=1 Tax=Alicyclobacillus cellulosilyticus TaxID=1003997 RepID=A0A917KHQ1_9BACL|nr:glutamate--tRNA ligase [Alicyclobacillus cellulosilyticus]GGJ12043.1 glutamate--tRNA ligase [Alicyclobacillus cellulosilyticus]